MRRSLQAASTDFENIDVNRSMTTATKRRMTLQEKRRQIFMASSTKIPLRPVRPTHPRNIMSFVPKKGHYASVPWTNIGGKATGVRGEYKYAINGPPSPRPIVHPPRSGPCPSSPPLQAPLPRGGKTIMPCLLFCCSTVFCRRFRRRFPVRVGLVVGVAAE